MIILVIKKALQFFVKYIITKFYSFILVVIYKLLNSDTDSDSDSERVSMSIKRLTPRKSDKQIHSYLQLQQYYKDHFSPSPKEALSKSQRTLKKQSLSPKMRHSHYQADQSLKLNQSAAKSQRKQKKQYSEKQLIEKLQKHRQKLSKTLQTYTLVYNLEHINKCLQHGCYISAYDLSKRKLLCAGCFTEIKAQKKDGEKTKAKINPLQKSENYLQSDIISLKSEIQNEIRTIEQIQNILYEGCNQQKKQMGEGLKSIDETFEKLILKLRQTQNILKDALQLKYRQEKLKHQVVVKQLGLLKTLAKEFIGRQQEFPKKQKLKPNEYYIASKINSYLQNTSEIQSHLRANFPYKKELFQELAFRHLVYRELSQTLKFNKSGLVWSKQKHLNMVKMVSQKVFKGIQQLSSLKLDKIVEDFL